MRGRFKAIFRNTKYYQRELELSWVVVAQIVCCLLAVQSTTLLQGEADADNKTDPALQSAGCC